MLKLIQLEKGGNDIQNLAVQSPPHLITLSAYFLVILLTQKLNILKENSLKDYP